MIEKLILGTVQMGLDYGINNASGKVSKNDAFEIFDFAISNGIDTLDTAELYGDAHQLIGSYNQNHTKFKAITKFPKISLDVSEKIGDFLKELSVPKLEAILFHSFESFQLNVDKLPEIETLKSKGIVDKVGVSIYTNEEFEKVIEYKEINIIQLPFNLLDNYSLRGKLIEKAKKAGKEIHVRSAFLQGLFFKDLNDDTKVVKLLKPHLEKLHFIALKNNISISTLALSYCLNQKLIDKVIIGVDKLEQLKENISQIAILDQDIISEIDKIVVEKISLLNPTTW